MAHTALTERRAEKKSQGTVNTIHATVATGDNYIIARAIVMYELTVCGKETRSTSKRSNFSNLYSVNKSSPKSLG